MIGYRLTRSECNGWVFCGTTPTEVALALKTEIEAHEGLSAEECDIIQIEAFDITQEEIDNMPEFQGW